MGFIEGEGSYVSEVAFSATVTHRKRTHCFDHLIVSGTKFSYLTKFWDSLFLVLVNCTNIDMRVFTTLTRE